MLKKIKLFDPVVGIKEEKAIKNVLNSGFWASGSGIGNVEKFEKEFQKFTKSKECIAVNSGTAALHLGLSLYDIKNKEVILPSLSFVSTAHAIIYNGGKPIFADVNESDLCLDTNDVERKISKKTAAIIPVHFGGMPANISKLEKIVNKKNIPIIEDAAHACGAQWNKKRIGSHSPVVCFSFHPVKNLAMPTGGLISINSNNHKLLKKKLVESRWCGITNRKKLDYDIKNIGWNYYMNEFSAAIGRIQLGKLDVMNKKRREIATRYHKEIQNEKMDISKNSVYHFYWILVKNRKKFQEEMNKMNIETVTHYKPIHKMSMYKKKIKLPVTDKIANEIITLPTHPNLTEENITRIINCVNKFSDR